MNKYVQTPAGAFAMPAWAADRLEKMTDIEILEEYVEKCKDFIDPFLFQEMADRGLTVRGDYYRDIVTRLEVLKAREAQEQSNDDERV